jgi:hypothetical protein
MNMQRVPNSSKMGFLLQAIPPHWSISLPSSIARSTSALVDGIGLV